MTILKQHTTASDIMTREPVCAEPSMTLRDLARLFEEHDISGAPVVDAQGRVIGVVSKTDLIRRCTEGVADYPPGYLFEMISEEHGEDAEILPEPEVAVEDFMSVDPITVGPTSPVSRVARLMSTAHVHRVVVIDEGRFPLGIITSLDVLRAFPGAHVE